MHLLMRLRLFYYFHSKNFSHFKSKLLPSGVIPFCLRLASWVFFLFSVHFITNTPPPFWVLLSFFSIQQKPAGGLGHAGPYVTEIQQSADKDIPLSSTSKYIALTISMKGDTFMLLSKCKLVFSGVLLSLGITIVQ